MPISQQTERVLVVPTSVFHEIGHFDGFCGDPDPYLANLFDSACTSFQPRHRIEDDPSYKQLIPYCIFRCDDRLFNYRRGKEQGEGRLHSKRSIGVGGHISSVDETGHGSVYESGLRREIEEEIDVDCRYEERCLGMINDDTTDVGRVHLGIVHVFDVEEPKVRPRESSMIDTGFAPAAELFREIAQFESWSQICLKHLFQ